MYLLSLYMPTRTKAHMDATLALRTKLRKGYGDKGSALAAAAAAAAAAASAAATKGHYSQ
jgi:hypothetical protein